LVGRDIGRTPDKDRYVTIRNPPLIFAFTVEGTELRFRRGDELLDCVHDPRRLLPPAIELANRNVHRPGVYSFRNSLRDRSGFEFLNKRQDTENQVIHRLINGFAAIKSAKTGEALARRTPCKQVQFPFL
jgi:hypothetical protein